MPLTNSESQLLLLEKQYTDDNKLFENIRKKTMDLIKQSKIKLIYMKKFINIKNINFNQNIEIFLINLIKTDKLLSFLSIIKDIYNELSVCYENNLLEFDSEVLKEHNKNIYEQKLIAELISIFNLNKNVKFLKILKENSEKSKIIFDQNFSNLQVSDVIKENWQQII
ncbi:hypothetical protein [Spiroplasma endosymbiont of Virgichneumon dumeticola]|uniref:hypothetical protein n=1 Tax=Spiroplasma endosymbiont of Virgichneumon dumeticola TaxID=3139323 RepID=UPI0035C885BF